MSTAASADASDPFADALTGLVDDAAIFPPGNAPVPDAVRGHGEHRSAWYGPLVGGLVCADTRLPELQAALDEAVDGIEQPLRVVLTISGGAGAIAPALTWVRRDERLLLTAVETALRDEEDLAHNAARVTTVLSGELDEDVTAFVEMPRLHGPDTTAGWHAALDEVAAAGHRAKFRTGGADHDAFPAAGELVTVVDACLDREVAFKCTAGLHHAVRHTAGDTGFEHHGFVNVLLATRALLDGASRDEVEALLEQRDPGVLAEGVRSAGPDAIASTRRWFTSFGSCSIVEPVDDLVALGLIRQGHLRPEPYQ